MNKYVLLIAMVPSYVFSSDAVIETILTSQFKNSTLSYEEKTNELAWFKKAASPYKGMTIRVVSEDLPTHWYEAEVLATTFEILTGIRVVHEVTGEHDVVQKINAQITYDYNIYDAYITDSDLIGLYSRSESVIPVSDLMTENDILSPYIDIDDYMGIPFVQGEGGKIYQLPDQQFANLYWFRYDWFNNPDFKKRFKARFGYELGVPLNWTAYRDIADFFTHDVGTINGERIYGHMDYGKKHPSLGWRFSDAWLSMAGVGDIGLPNGEPVDEWGIRSEACMPVGASIERGGALNGPAANYALTAYKDWLLNYAPPEAKEMTFSQAGGIPSQGNIAQQIFWYTAFTSEMTSPDLTITDSKGLPKWRMAPSPVGAYWSEGMKKGYQDTGAWTFLKSTPEDNRHAAWLYAQFVTSKTVTMDKFLVGLTPIRYSDVNSDFIQDRSANYGGLIEFYSSSAAKKWTPSGKNIPDYSQMSDLWWKNLSTIIHDGVPVDLALDTMAAEMDNTLLRISNSRKINICFPKLNDKKDEDYWLKKPGAPKSKIKNEWPEGKTAPYEDIIQSWQ
ncbi:ABC transporter substrate-binding protein [Salinivibrio proteolyticus]|uniref:ABC transporter substrate-binding protein n=1 Tax=Salinivibrio proteolyticus TaxID=334715 RepID=UPI000988FBBD|nr:ABC transporter substrate-binding protein [Salinivibrio proteolyticus]OOF21776.1 ABC transporter substrate-binding protein [Salinivibrio proteolyticus]